MNHNKGFTLIEIIVSLALISLVAVAFLTMSTSAFTGIYSAGDKSKILFNAQGLLENKLASHNSAPTVGTENITIVINGVSCNITGQYVTQDYVYRGQTRHFTYFIPN